MNNKSRLGARAKMCREEASLRWSDPAAEQHWLELAAEYDRLAETEVLMASRPPAAAVQRQPMQQQQQQKKKEDG